MSPRIIFRLLKDVKQFVLIFHWPYDYWHFVNQYNDTLRDGLKCDTQHNNTSMTLSNVYHNPAVIMLCYNVCQELIVVLLSDFVEWHYAEFRYAECHYAKILYAESH